jgi:hypothetical protein
MPDAEATILANGADFFIRDFVVDQLGLNLFDEPPGIVRQFAGNWYIVTTVEPAAAELQDQLRGIAEFYRYLRRRGLISAGYLAAVENECADIDYYERRIESFWQISGEGYSAWERECSLKNSRAVAAQMTPGDTDKGGGER